MQMMFCLKKNLKLYILDKKLSQRYNNYEERDSFPDSETNAHDKRYTPILVAVKKT
jgi:hypothetical protein